MNQDYAVRVLSVGESLIRGPEIFWMRNWDDMLPLAFNVTLVQGHGITALVNTSPPDTDAYCREHFPAHEVPHRCARRGPGAPTRTEHDRARWPPSG